MAVYEVIAAGVSEMARRAWPWLVLHGVLLVVLGVVALVAPLSTALALAVLVGIFAIVDGLASLVAAFRYRDVVGRRWAVRGGSDEANGRQAAPSLPGADALNAR